MQIKNLIITVKYIRKNVIFAKVLSHKKCHKKDLKKASQKIGNFRVKLIILQKNEKVVKI